MIGLLIVTHGNLGQEVLRTAEDIAGRQEQAASISVTSETGMDGLHQAFDEVLGRLSSGDGVLILVDMLGGSPCNAALLKTKSLNAEIVTGVNLYMILSAFRHRQELALKELANKVAEDGKRAIVQPKELLLKRLG
ncbi:MAG TPA: PTS sugar transporter subunit IIA [Elusimicrobiota bacterium]|nr:PTS sugar transporter subunit IIA [Elusimicrobiota bacterium]